MKLNFTNHALKFLKKLKISKIALQFALKIKELEAKGHLNDTIALKGKLEGCYRVDVGEYRIIYKEENGGFTILLIGKRNDSEVYKIMERLS